MRRIKYFLAVAEEQHFGRAADKLHICQPPLSHQIRLLEKDLGVALFVRTTRRVELTEAGRSLYEGARQAVEQLDQAITAAQRIQGGYGGKLRIGFVSTVAFKMLSEVLHVFRDRYPHATPELFHLTSSQQAEALRAGSIDVGFCRTPPGGNIESRVIEREPLFVALPGKHPLVKRKTISVEALKDQPFVMWDREQTTGIARTILSVCNKHGFDPKVALEVTNPSAMLGFVADGVGVAIVPGSVLLLKPDHVAFRPLDDKAYSTISLAWRPENRSKLVPHFVAMVDEICDQHTPSRKSARRQPIPSP